MNTTNAIAGVLLVGGLGYGAYLQQGEGADGTDTLKVGLAVITGLIVLVWNNFDKIKGLFRTRIPSEQVFFPKDFRTRDLDAINHLQLRCAKFGSQEGLDVCAKLNSIMFELNQEVQDARSRPANALKVENK
jgi:hypothetical protein